MGTLRIAILGSGKGSNARALLEAWQTGASSYYTPALLVSDVADAGILKLGEEFELPAHFFDPGPFKTKFAPEREGQLVSFLQEAKIELIALAGFMRIIKEPLLKAFPDRILNIHPSLLPAFPGLKAWEQATAAKAKESGCTVHVVDGGIDTGAILTQRRVPLFEQDTASTLHSRIQEAEHELYPASVDAFAKAILERKNPLASLL